LERLNKEIKLRTNVVCTFYNEPAIRRIDGTLMLGKNGEWAVAPQYTILGTIAASCDNNSMNSAKITAL
jgi:putative transposase